MKTKEQINAEWQSKKHLPRFHTVIVRGNVKQPWSVYSGSYSFNEAYAEREALAEHYGRGNARVFMTDDSCASLLDILTYMNGKGQTR